METKRFDLAVSAPEYIVANKSTVTRTKRVGTVVREVAVGTFDATTTDSAGVANTTIATHGMGVYLPANAVITGVTIDVVTTFTSATDAATIALGYTSSTGAFTAALAISDATNVWDAGLHAAKIGNYSLDGNALSQVASAAGLAASYVKITAIKELVAAVAVEVLTAGKLNIFVEYFISD